MKNYVTYLRVSSEQKQGSDGLGISAQRKTTEDYASRNDGVIIKEFVEAESGSIDDRPMLISALAYAKSNGATLLVAKLDRLSRSSVFLIRLKQSNTDFECCDLPMLDQFSVGLFSLLAERERTLISQRTKLGLDAARRRGIKLGGPVSQESIARLHAGATQAKVNFRNKMLPIIEEIEETGATTYQQIADCLMRRGYKTRTGKDLWHTTTIKNLLDQRN